MKLNETLKLTSDPIEDDNMINEALRVSRNDMERFIKLNQRDSKVGIEYEFHLNHGVIQTSSRGGSNASEAARELALDELDNRILNSLHPLAKICVFMFQIFDDGTDFVNALEGEDDEYSDMTPNQKLSAFAKLIHSSRTAFNNFVLGDVIFEQGIEDDDIVGNLKTIYSAPLDISSTESIMAFMRRHESTIDSLLDALDNIGMTTNLNMNTQRLVREVKESSWYEDELDAETSAALDVIADDFDGGDGDNVEYVKDTIPRGLLSGIQEITLDSSVPDGVEVITKPLFPDDAFDFMNVMFEYIKEHGSTSMKTGMHVNISHKSFLSGQLPDPLKIIALMDTDFFQDSTNVKKHTKYVERNNMVERLTSSISNAGTLSLIARGYVEDGLAGMEDVMKHVMVRGVKFRSVNWTHFLQEYDPSLKRIEMRFFGGQSYEKRYDEIVNDIKFILYVVNAVSNSAYKPEVYYRGLHRILDRAAKRAGFSGFNEVLQKTRKGEL